MLKTIKKVVLGSLSILGIGFLSSVLFFFNPNWSYANKTSFPNVTVYHNQPLHSNANTIVQNAVAIIKKSALFDENIHIQLCMNDDKLYPKLNPLAGQPLAYASLNKAIFKNCNIHFDKNRATAQWEINNNELRKFDLTWLLAHEFTHNLQFHENTNYVIKSTLGQINWKLEGHAEYIGRKYKNDGRLKEKIQYYKVESQKEHVGFPSFELEDGTRQSVSYFQYALVIQYLMEEKGLNYQQICKLETNLDTLYQEMIEWSKS